MGNRICFRQMRKSISKKQGQLLKTIIMKTTCILKHKQVGNNS